MIQFPCLIFGCIPWKTLHSKTFIHNFWISSNYRPHDFRIFVDSKQSKLIPSISPVWDECCIIILWKTCSTFGSYLPETVVELGKFFCCSFLNFDLLLAQLSFPHSCRRWKYEYCFCENISHAKKTTIKPPAIINNALWMFPKKCDCKFEQTC